MSILTLIFCIPLLAALLILLVPRDYRFVIRCLALLGTLASAVLATWAFFQFQPSQAGFQFEDNFAWIPSLGIRYHVGVDGINIGLVLMGAIVAFAATCLSKEITRREKEFYVLLMFMSAGILGAFVSLDLFMFYFLHELALVPTFIMIGVWGHGVHKNLATFRITLYLSLGALIALVGLIALVYQSGAASFDMVQINSHLKTHPLPLNVQSWIFPLLLFGFGILVSLWPFHTWAPMGYGSAPTATAMMHAGVIKKFGLYGIIRVALPFLPEGSKSWMHLLAILCLGNILFCGWVAMRQRNFNLLLGNSSVAHMGMAFLGIASLSILGISGTVLVMVAHGFLAALTFGLSGYLRHHSGTLEMSEMGGLLKKVPFIGAVLIMAMFAGCGLPGFANFPGELLVLFGAWNKLSLYVVFAAWGALVIGAIYCLRAVRQILHGPVDPQSPGASIPDATGLWRKLPFALLLFCLLGFGFYPQALTSKIGPSVIIVMNHGDKPVFKVDTKPGAGANLKKNKKTK